MDSDLNDLIEKALLFDDNKFIYLTYTVPPSSELFTPYSLQAVDYQHVNPAQYFTLSRWGVTSWGWQEKHFTDINTWRTEYNLFRRIITVCLALSHIDKIV